MCTSFGADGIVVSESHVRQVIIPVILSLVDDHSEHLGHGMIHALDAAVAVRMIGACRNFAHAVQLVNSVRQLGSELEAVVGEETNAASPPRDVFVDEMYLSAVPSAVRSAAETEYMSVRRVRRSVKRRI